MSYLAKVTKGKIRKPEFILIYGVEGVGKSTFAAEAPEPIFLPLEDGSNSLDVARFPVAKHFDEVIAMLKELPNSDYSTLVIDSMDHLEPLVWAKTVEVKKAEQEWNKVTNIEDFGYGKGFAFAVDQWAAIFYQLERIREKMNVILIAHHKIKTMNDPTKPLPYDKYGIKLQERAAALSREKCDAVLFAAFDVLLLAQKNGQKAKAVGGESKRVLYTRNMPGHEAKNRDGLPYEIPLSWASYIEAKEKAEPEDPETLKSIIATHLESVTDEALKARVIKARDEAGNDALKLSKIVNRLETLKGESK